MGDLILGIILGDFCLFQLFLPCGRVKIILGKSIIHDIAML